MTRSVSSAGRPSTLTTSNSDVYAAFRKRGCPLCRTVAASEERSVASFLREGRQVPSARERFLRAGGYCPRHAWQLHGAATGEATGAGIADLYGQLARRDLGALEELAGIGGKAGSREIVDRLARPQRCPMCISVEEAERRSATFLCELLEDELGRASYRDSDGLCYPHLTAAVEASLVPWPKGEEARFLLEDWRDRLDSLRVRLAEYDRKRSYTAASERTPEDERTWTEVVERYAGTG